MNINPQYLLFSIIFAFIACSRANDLRTSVCFTTQHHDQVIGGITIYIKFNSETFPGFDPENYDTSIESDANGRVCMQDFPLGHHWFIGYGYDPQVRDQVVGTWDTEFNLRNLQVDTILYVGEE